MANISEWMQAKHGPFPGWAYIGIGGIGLVYLFLRKKGSSTASTAQTAGNPLTTTPADFGYIPGSGGSPPPNPPPGGPPPGPPPPTPGPISGWVNTPQGPAWNPAVPHTPGAQALLSTNPSLASSYASGLLSPSGLESMAASIEASYPGGVAAWNTPGGASMPLPHQNPAVQTGPVSTPSNIPVPA